MRVRNGDFLVKAVEKAHPNSDGTWLKTSRCYTHKDEHETYFFPKSQEVFLQPPTMDYELRFGEYTENWDNVIGTLQEIDK